ELTNLGPATDSVRSECGGTCAASRSILSQAAPGNTWKGVWGQLAYWTVKGTRHHSMYAGKKGEHLRASHGVAPCGVSDPHLLQRGDGYSYWKGAWPFLPTS